MKKKIPKIIVFLLIMTITFVYTVKWLDSINLELDNETVELLLESSLPNNKKNQLINKLITIIKNADFIDPVKIMIDNYKTDEESEEVIKVSGNNEDKNLQNTKTIVYIYNSHQTESYIAPKEINLNYTVLDASYYLQRKLQTYGINSYVEKASIQDILNTNNWNYASSYRVSRMFLEQRKKENNDLTYFVDLHRDSVGKEISTIEINGKKYAKILFLLGLENDNYKKNEVIIEKLNNWLNNNYKGISRGIYKKEGKGVNGVYNQDFSENCILIEIGGQDNTYEEVENTVDVVAEMLNYYIGESYDQKNS